MLYKVNWRWVVDRVFLLALFGLLYMMIYVFWHYNVTILVESIDTQVIQEQTVVPPSKRQEVNKMQIKKGVNLNGLKPEIAAIFPVLECVYQSYGAEAVITSGVEGSHGDYSHHFKGLAVDVRTRNVNVNFHKDLVNKLKFALSEQYQVVYENNHIHVEFDPKEHIA
jgi:hypothetical protein